MQKQQNLHGSGRASLNSAAQACRTETQEWAGGNEQWVTATACADSTGGKQGIALGKEDDGGFLSSTAEKGTEAVDDVADGGPGCLFEPSLTAKVSSDGGPV